MISHLRVLVVDDDPSILEVLGAHLDARGYATRMCENAREALEVLPCESFDLIISDINMAEMNGFEFLKIARERWPRSGIVLMTAYQDRYPLSEALRAGADGYISKPFTLEKFSLIFERAYWNALSRQDWWENHDDGTPNDAQTV